ncbi:MAG: DUF3365 domain-containing protein [Aquabacterium sp.]
MKKTWAWSVLVLTAAMGGAAVLGGKSILESAVVAHTVSESRTVADMAETVGRWASQYGGLHARTVGASAPIPGSFLTRSVYAGQDADGGVLQGSAAGQRAAEMEALARMEVYHWKNPVLIQREVADVLLAGGSRAQYRMTARTVLNPNNAPTPFEIEALDAIQAKHKQAKGGDAAAYQANKGLEYWKVDKGQLLYARAVIGQKSCMTCHDSPEKAPAFLRTNQQFNGGGGFGYQVGQPVGLISVKLPLPEPETVLKETLPQQAWVWLVLAAGAGVGLLLLGGMGLFKSLRGSAD